jgi:aldose sugar dehydrogenase
MDIKKVIIVGVTALSMAFAAQAQIDVEAEKALASQTIQLYFDGWGTGDTTKVGKAMHSSCHLKYYRDGKWVDVDRNSYLSGFKPRERDKNLVTRIVLLDITENIASAKTEIDTGKFLFTDYFNLIKTDEGWFIVDKVSVRKAK